MMFQYYYDPLEGLVIDFNVDIKRQEHETQFYKCLLLSECLTVIFKALHDKS